MPPHSALLLSHACTLSPFPLRYTRLAGAGKTWAVFSSCRNCTEECGTLEGVLLSHGCSGTMPGHSLRSSTTGAWFTVKAGCGEVPGMAGWDWNRKKRMDMAALFQRRGRRARRGCLVDPCWRCLPQAPRFVFWTRNAGGAKNVLVYQVRTVSLEAYSASLPGSRGTFLLCIQAAV
jgi:hypothetical protein